MAKSRFLLDVQPREADSLGYYDLLLDIGRLLRTVRGEPCLDRLCTKMQMTRGEVLKTLTPGAYLDPPTGEVSINAGYDPDFDEGVLEAMIWSTIGHEVRRVLLGDIQQTKHPRRQPTSRSDDNPHADQEP